MDTSTIPLSERMRTLFTDPSCKNMQAYDILDFYTEEPDEDESSALARVADSLDLGIEIVRTRIRTILTRLEIPYPASIDSKERMRESLNEVGNI